MNPLDLQSEKYSPTGNVASEGVLNQLGRPKMDMLTVLVREAAQNSWDAKRSDSDHVRFGIGLRTLTSEQQRVLVNSVFLHTPESIALGEELSTDAPVTVMEIWDRGTSGLGGPTRADVSEGSNEYRDFVDFFRNVGHPPDKRLGGGTFGYGKAILYLTSAVQTICVHTHARDRGQFVQRFMAATLGNRYSTDAGGPQQGQFTGRHWWGRRSRRDEIVDPEIGKAADQLASSLGMPVFDHPHDRGTTIMILSPNLADRTPVQALNVMKQAVMWYFWPKMIAIHGERPSMTFELRHNGTQIPVPSPSEVAPLHGFVQAMELLKGGTEAADANPLGELLDIDSFRPKQHLGKLALVRFARQERETVDTGPDNGMLPFSGPAHHVALMRQAELVVKYVAGPPLETNALEYAGVFLADEEVDRVFARAEPPTHDDWVHEFLNESREKTYVRVAFRRIDEAVETFVTPEGLHSTDGETAPLGAFAGSLGTLLVGEVGPGAGVEISRSRWEAVQQEDESGIGDRSGKGMDRTAGTRGKSRSKARVKILDEGRLAQNNGTTVFIASFTIQHAEGSWGTRVKANAGVVLDGNQLENEPPAGDEKPRIILWRDPEKIVHDAESDQSLDVPATASNNGTWEAYVQISGDLMFQLELSAEVID